LIILIIHGSHLIYLRTVLIWPPIYASAYQVTSSSFQAKTVKNELCCDGF
jgi:hypothetical protein